MAAHKAAVIAGDGIGREVVPEGVRVLEKVASRFGLELAFIDFPWSCEHYEKHGRMMPEDGLDRLRPFDAIFLGAVGWPSVPDHVSLWGLLIPIRRAFDQYVNLPPVRLFEGGESPLPGKMPGDIRFRMVRETSDGECDEFADRLYAGSDREMAVQESV